MILDNLTTCVTIWAGITATAILAIAYCKGCCIAKLLGKPCSTK